jgi:hypothetical protein
MKRGIIVGSAMAGFCVEKFGPARLKEITKDDIDRRVQRFKEVVSFEIELVQALNFNYPGASQVRGFFIKFEKTYYYASCG